MIKIALISAACAMAAWSQTTNPEPTKVQVEKDAVGTIGITAALSGPMSTVAGAPYSAQAVTERIQTLADGNRITQTTTNNVARDSKGRVRREESLPGPSNGGEAPHLVLIEDPVSGVHITLDSNNKIAIRLTMQSAKKEAEASTIAARTGPGPVILGMAPVPPGAFQMVTSQSFKIDGTGGDVTDLGTQTIEGVSAKGKRQTHTIPAGQVGNDLPIVITTETWYSPDLKVMVMSKSTDPRMGETTYRLTNISRGEPDPSLFQIPADYKVKDQPQNVLFIQPHANGND